MKSVLIFGLAMLLSGCASRVHAKKRGYPAPIPDCAGGFVWVPDGCRLSTFAEYVEVDCPGSTTKFSRCAKP
ncbi:MAG TPA: hypothetical protein VKQ28_16750 [Candidatus Acidoferrum sp.]|nr:hypothetical protein [Candidatus Acidoferrum sp.]